MSSTTYEISGPTEIGSEGQLNQILGDIQLSDITLANGSLLYTDANNNLQSLDPPSSNSILLFNNSGSPLPAFKKPEWFSINGQLGQTLTTSAANIIGWNFINSYPLYGFYMLKNGSQVISAPATTATNINNWTLGANTEGEYDLIGPVLLNANTGIATIDFNGIYVINCGVQLTTANVIGSRVLRVAKNDVTVIAEQQWESNLVSGQFQIQNISITAQLEAKDLISVQVFNADGAINPITINTGGTYWGIHRLALT